ncbi:MAG: RecX family transcriptional regulator [Chitinophagales bacterium]|nr:RecX family transcriptional regulator [Chitinophagales bacterium]
MVSKNKTLTHAQVVERMRKYCAYQERSHQEVRHKLLELGERGNELENSITILIEEGFLDEERFARAFARGKFRMKNWGRNKIVNELKRRAISGYCINKAMTELNKDEYEATLRKLAEKKAASFKDLNIFTCKKKLSDFLIRKGYEPEQAWKAANSIYKK